MGNQFMPLIAYTMLESLEILHNVIPLFQNKCIMGITANPEVCKDKLFQSRTIATIFVPLLGYSKVENLIKESIAKKKSIKDLMLEQKLMTEKEIDDLLSQKNV